MAIFNNFLEGVATQVINTGLRKVAGNIPGLNISINSGSNASDTYSLTAPTGNLQNYTFPLDVTSDAGLGNQGHYMMFYINQQNHAKLNFGGKGGKSPAASSKRYNNLDSPLSLSPLNAPGALRAQYGSIAAGERARAKKVNIKRAPTTRMTTAIAMYMPATVTTGYTTQYTDTEMGFLTANAIDAYEKFAQGNMRGGLNEIGSMDQNLAAALQAMMLNTLGALPGLAGVKAAAEMRSGVVLSDRMELAFKGIDKRTFQYEFKMNPKSEEEAKEIRNIVNAFKFNMLPEFEGSDSAGRKLIVPNTFDIQYMWNGAENHFLHKISTCVLESMNVSYGGDRYKTHAGIGGDGAPPIETSLSLTFKELDLVTREKAVEGF